MLAAQHRGEHTAAASTVFVLLWSTFCCLLFQRGAIVEAEEDDGKRSKPPYWHGFDTMRLVWERSTLDHTCLDT
jgi:hypothetical protein